MSGIYIHGMKMPKDEKAIHLEIHSDGIVLMWQMGDDDKVVGTAIELPPHGRLIDADALFKAMFQCSDGSIIGDKDIDGWPHEARYADIKRFIRQAPTIIPADGGAYG